MYSVDERDEVIEIRSVPQSNIGAPIPALMATEHEVILAFYLEDTPDDWDGSRVRVLDASTSNEPIAVVTFKSCYAHMFGPPNDEAFSGHPLESRGLRPYSVFRIKNSSWLRGLEKMNSVHPEHEARQFNCYTHYVFAFHDTTFECIAKEFDVVITLGSIRSALLDTIAAVE